MTIESLPAYGIDTNMLLEQTRGYRLLRDIALAMAVNPKIRVTKGKPGGGAIELSDFEKVSKMGRLAVMCMVEDVRPFGANKPVESQQNSNTHSLSEFLSVAEETGMPRCATHHPAT